MSHLCLQNALKVANGEYQEEGLIIDFMAVSALNDALVESVGLDKDRIDGIPASRLQEGLVALLTRHQHSEEFYSLVEQGRKLIIYTAQQDRRVLTDLKNWDNLSHDERLASTNYFANLVRDIFVSHIELPPNTHVVVTTKRPDTISAVDYAAFGIIAPPPPQKDMAGHHAEQIILDTSSEGFQDGCLTYTHVYMKYLPLIERSLPGYNLSAKFGTALSHDIDLCRTAVQQKAYIDPLLKDSSLYHFSGMLTRVEGDSMLKDLETMMETHGEDIPVYHKPTFREKISMFLGARGLHL